MMQCPKSNQITHKAVRHSIRSAALIFIISLTATDVAGQSLQNPSPSPGSSNAPGVQNSPATQTNESIKTPQTTPTSQATNPGDDLNRAKSLLNQQKTEDALTILYGIFGDSKASQTIDIAHLVFDSDPKIDRLIRALDRKLSSENDVRARVELSSMLGRLYIAKRDYGAAQRSFSQGGTDPGLMLASARLLLLLGQGDQSQKILDMLASNASDANMKQAVAITKAWKLWSIGDLDASKKALTGFENDPGVLYLLYLISLGRKDAKDALQQSDLLRSKFPHSVYASMLDDDTVHADPTVALLLGLDIGNGFDNPVVQSGLPLPDAAPKGIQVGYFKAKENADKLAASLKAKGFNIQVDQDLQGGLRFVVLVLIRSGQDPQTLLSQLKDQGIEGFLVF